MPNEPKADDFTEELRQEGVRGYTTQVCRWCRWEGGRGQLVNGTCPACKGDKHSEQARGLDRLHPGPYRVQHIAEAIRSAHASGAREAEEKRRHPGSEPPDVRIVVLGYWAEKSPQTIYHSEYGWVYAGTGTMATAPDFWLDLPDASRVGGKDTK
jgi:hypothetical protein